MRLQNSWRRDLLAESWSDQFVSRALAHCCQGMTPLPPPPFELMANRSSLKFHYCTVLPSLSLLPTRQPFQKPLQLHPWNLRGSLEFQPRWIGQLELIRQSQWTGARWSTRRWRRWHCVVFSELEFICPCRGFALVGGLRQKGIYEAWIVKKWITWSQSISMRGQSFFVSTSPISMKRVKRMTAKVLYSQLYYG